MKVTSRPAPVNTAPKNLHSADDADEEKELSDSDPCWGRREAARLRQIMIGKARPEYRRYIAEIPAAKRDPSQPTTPDPRARVSKRQFDRSLGEWRRRLHEFDIAPSADNSASVRSSESTKPPGVGGSPSKHGDSANRKSTSQRRPRASRAERPQTGRPATVRFGGQEDDGDDSAGIVRLRLAEQLPANRAPHGGQEDDGDDGAGIVRLRLAEQLSELPVPRVAWTLPDELADKVDTNKVVSLADKLPDPVKPQQSRSAVRVGPQQPEDTQPPPPAPRDEKIFPEAGAVKNGEFHFDLVKAFQLDEMFQGSTGAQDPVSMLRQTLLDKADELGVAARHLTPVLKSLDALELRITVVDEPARPGQPRRLHLPAEYAPAGGSDDDDEESVSSSSPRFVAPSSHTASPHTPARQCLVVNPPASVEATPPRVMWAMDTPSPERMYHMMPPPPVLNLANIGQILNLAGNT